MTRAAAALGENESVDIADRVRHLVRGMCSFLDAKVEPLVAENNFRRPGSAPRPPVFVVGRTVKLPRELRDAAKNADLGAHWKLQHPYVVIGHWRWQPIGHHCALHGEEGPRNAIRIRIAPYSKGPSDAEACRKAPCGWSQAQMRGDGLRWNPAVGCPYLRLVGIQWRCGMFIDATPEKKAAMTADMGIGFGCSSTLFNTDRDEMIRRLNAGRKGP